mgnify:CR=1 FL=1
MSIGDPPSVSRTVVAGPPPFDPEVAAALAAWRATEPALPFTVANIPALRPLEPPPPTDVEIGRRGQVLVETRSAPGPAGAPEVPLLICRPAGEPGPLGVIYLIHGGGLVKGDHRSPVPKFLDWALELRLTLVSVDYRLAPETPHPGPVSDCYAGLVWIVEHAAELCLDPERVVVAGGSAGGGLAAAVALLARDRHGPALAGQMLLCPMLDDRNDTPSAVQLTGVDHWDRPVNEVAWTALLGSARARVARRVPCLRRDRARRDAVQAGPRRPPALAAPPRRRHRRRR